MRFLSLIALAATTTLIAADPPLSKGFDHFYNLEFDEALVEFERLAKQEPDNPERHNHIAHTILYRDMFEGGALESELVTGSNPFLNRPKITMSGADQERFHAAINRAMELANEQIKKNPNDTKAMYALGVALCIRANYNFIVMKAFRDALRDATAGRKLHNRVSELEPSLLDARMVQGAHDYVVGSLPWTIKVLGFLVGFRGDREEGMKTLHMVATKGAQNRIEASVLLAAIYRRERRAQEAIPLLNEMVTRFPRNYLFRFELVQMYGDLGRKNEALAILSRLEELKKTSAPGYRKLPAEKIWFSRGNLLFWHNDLDRSITDLQKATANPDALGAGMNAVAWVRLAQAYDLKGQRPQALEAYKRAIAVAPESETAKDARRYLSSPYRRS